MAKAEHAELLKKARAAAEAAADEILTALRGVNANPQKAEKPNDKRNAERHDVAERNDAPASKAVHDTSSLKRMELMGKCLHAVLNASWLKSGKSAYPKSGQRIDLTGFFVQFLNADDDPGCE